MKGEERSGRIIKAKRLKDGFTFQLSVDHIIEQTLLKQFNSPKFQKSTIKIEDSSASETESDDSETKKKDCVPIKLKLKRKYAEVDSTSSSDADLKSGYGNNNDEPLDMSTKRRKRTHAKKTDDLIPAIPPGWMVRGWLSVTSSPYWSVPVAPSVRHYLEPPFSDQLLAPLPTSFIIILLTLIVFSKQKPFLT
ncbi:hypothetical protein EB796_016008 [Bugula neritina]|uniref:Uncharacterized protein n=1 Tax=Bugula neritina TaxID=10212 RepID=A0A7J7JI59_BUGNE|nr:hypothetical protein EB796_016008 [Bugula neritina]